MVGLKSKITFHSTTCWLKNLRWCAKFYNCIRLEELTEGPMRKRMVTHSQRSSFFCAYLLWLQRIKLLFLGSQLFPIVGQGVKMLVRHKSTTTTTHMTPFTSFNHALTTHLCTIRNTTTMYKSMIKWWRSIRMWVNYKIFL